MGQAPRASKRNPLYVAEIGAMEHPRLELVVVIVAKILRV